MASLKAAKCGNLSKRNSMVLFPKKGEYVAVNLSPAEGHEQQGYRPALVVSETKLNRHGLVWALPITNTLHGPGRFILPDGEPVQGAVLFTQIRSLDLSARSFVRKGEASDDVLEEALGKIAAVLGIG